MRLQILFLVLFSGLLLSITVPADAANRSRTASKASDLKEIPAFNWDIVSSGFMEEFRLHNREIESAEPNRYFPGAVAFALGRMDDSGHYLMLKCSSADSCEGKRDALEERLVYSTLLEVVRTPKARKDQLYNASTWELTPLGEKYIEKLRKRYPNLSTRLARLVGAAFAGK